MASPQRVATIDVFDPQCVFPRTGETGLILIRITRAPRGITHEHDSNDQLLSHPRNVNKRFISGMRLAALGGGRWTWKEWPGTTLQRVNMSPPDPDMNP